jgi:DNA invertase Pin-like site-specific DNA recombinase
MTHEIIKEIKPAIYARLSDEDKDLKKNRKKDNSVSIENQIDMLKAFVKDKEWQEPKVFFDDDRTGTNFDRKGFQNMYSAAQQGDINVIVINDTTRFGRNWGKSGYYFNRLEEMGVRCIFVQEGIDTNDPDSPAFAMLPFYFVFAEMTSSAASKKIRAVFKNQAETGQHRSYYVPYGYIKDPADKYKLVIDPYPASIVKRIFAWRLEKLSCGTIARLLNNEEILSPNGYNIGKYDLETENKKIRLNKWSSGSVKGILENPTYCGDVAQNRVGCVSYKNQKQGRKPPSEWIIVKDKHEALISREDFQKCIDIKTNSGRLRGETNISYANISPFKSLLICKDCGYKMARTGTYYIPKSTGERKLLLAYNCGAFANMGKAACSSHYILENDLKELVIADIREKAGSVLHDEKAVRERFYAIKAQTSGTKLNTDRNALNKINKRLADLDKLLEAAFEKSVLTDEADETKTASDVFKKLERKYAAEKQDLTKQVKLLTASIEKQSQTAHDVETFIALLKKYVNITELDRATAAELIDHITISASAVKPREIVIYYNLIGNIE